MSADPTQILSLNLFYTRTLLDKKAFRNHVLPFSAILNPLRGVKNALFHEPLPLQSTYLANDPSGIISRNTLQFFLKYPPSKLSADYNRI